MKEPNARADLTISAREGKTFNDIGIVLRAHKLGEADRILRVLCRDHGKRSAVAKGVRRTHSKFGARLEVLSCAKMMIYKGRSLDIIKQAETFDSFQEIRNNIEIYAGAQVMAEFVDFMTHDNEPCREVFDLFYGCLSVLRDHPDKMDLILPFFDLRLLSLSGIGISLDSCACCGISLPGLSSVISPKQGGFLCTRCTGRSETAGGVLRVSEEAKEFFRYMNSLELDRIYEEEITKRVFGEVRTIMDRLIEYITERESRARKVARNLRNRKS